MENKPNILYRGIKVDYNNLPDFEFTGIDLKVNYPPIIDRYGRKTVSDGNEYGVYMTDNLNMVLTAYGNNNNDGIPLHNYLTVNNERIILPSVAVIYEINTNNLAIRKPFISDQLKGHYNNGFQGDEWIADIVPAANYTLYRVQIGRDILHEAENIDLTNPETIKEQIKQKLEMRKYRLETFAHAMDQMPSFKRNFLTKEELNILKLIYGKNGLKYLNEDKLITDNMEGMLKYLIAKIFKQNELNIDFETLKYINNLKKRATDINSIINIIKSDKIKNKNPQKLDYLISLINNRINKKYNENKTKEDQEWEKIKEKDISELEKKQFKEMLNKKMQEIGYNFKLFSDDLKEDEQIDNIENSEKRIM